MGVYTTQEIQLPVSCKTFNFATGTWTYSANSGIPFLSKSAADETSTVTIPVMLPFMSGQFGVKLKAIKVPIRIATANLDAVIAGTLFRTNYYLAATGGGVDMTATSVSITETGAEVTAAATDRLYTVTISNPDWVHTSTVNLVGYQLSLVLNAATTSAIRVYDAIAVFEVLS